jgi:guanylate cyclase
VTLVDVIERLASLGSRSGESPDDRARSGALILGSFTIAILSFVWVIVYLAYDEPLAAAIPATYQVVTVIGLIVLARTERFGVFRVTQLTLFILLPCLLQLALGGFFASSGVVLWSSVTPLAALALVGVRGAIPWLVAFLIELAVLAALDPIIARAPAQLPASIQRAFFALNIAGVLTSSFVILAFFVRRFEEERDRSERLLRNVLPGTIADRLKAGSGTIADHHPEVTVLFADLAGFTGHAAAMSPESVVGVLDDIFRRFDALATAEGLEKIKTIGDAYMVAGGVPEPRPDHAEAIARVALGMLSEVALMRQTHPWLEVRIGIESGPVVAGVIGRSRFIYDLWGDTVNVASRMESHGVPGAIQVGPVASAALAGAFVLEPRGSVDIKGKGVMATTLLIEPRV